MREEILNNIAEKLIKPKYPWIDSFDWEKTVLDEKELWILNIYPNADFIGRRSKMMNLIYQTEITEEMRSIFPMLGPEPNEKFWGVDIGD